MNIKTIIFLFSSCIFMGLTLVSSSAQETKSLSGSRYKIEDVIQKRVAVFVGKINDLGGSSGRSIGVDVYHRVMVTCLQNLSGHVDTQLKVRLNVSWPDEAPPVLNTPYIFVVRKEEGSLSDYDVLKLLPATDDNIAKVKALIAAAPPPK
jgi:hypothetical protein